MADENAMPRPPRPTERVKMKTVGKLRNTSGHALTGRRPAPEDTQDDAD